jgi:diaminopimelate epimerase
MTARGANVLRMTKYHGLGNDFLVASWSDNPDLAPDPTVVRALCRRHRGVGADGLIYALAPGGDDADVHMVLLNADGSEAEISGNGIRCLAQAVLRSSGRSEGEVLIETVGGLRRVRTVRGDVDGEMWMQVDLGPPAPGPPLSAEARSYPALRRTTIDVGNPHLVLQVEDPAVVDLSVDGPALETSFADGINVHLVTAPTDHDLRLRVWERGAGITEACGSGAVAAVVAAHDWGLVGERVDVHMPGGDAVVDLADGTALLTGPSTFVAEVVVP